MIRMSFESFITWICLKTVILSYQVFTALTGNSSFKTFKYFLSYYFNLSISLFFIYSLQLVDNLNSIIWLSFHGYRSIVLVLTATCVVTA